MTKIFNFRCHERTKQKFQQICRENRLGMTTVLNQFIADFIEKHETKAKQQSQEVQYSLLDFYSSEDLR
jgi:antitoxin component of RelBE/YafQ-DinJ toxin-antitoxin module